MLEELELKQALCFGLGLSKNAVNSGHSDQLYISILSHMEEGFVQEFKIREKIHRPQNTNQTVFSVSVNMQNISEFFKCTACECA